MASGAGETQLVTAPRRGKKTGPRALLGLVGLSSFGSAFADLFKSHLLVGRIALCDRQRERIEAFAGDWNRRDDYGQALER